MQDQPSDNAGGQGGGYVPTRSDMVIMRRAVREGRYPITSEHDALAVERAVDLAIHSRSRRARLAGLKVLVAMKRVNIMIDDREQPERPQEVIVTGAVAHIHEHEHRLTVEEFSRLSLADRARFLRAQMGIQVSTDAKSTASGS